MSDFSKIVSVLRSIGIGVTVENYESSVQVATIQGEKISGGFSLNNDSLLFTENELSVIRELLSHMACGYERETFWWHCCDANEIIQKIDKYYNDKKEGSF